MDDTISLWRSKTDGALKLILKDMFNRHTDVQEVVFRGRTRLDTKRQLIRYWSIHQNELGMKLSEFLQCCILMKDNKTIIFKGSMSCSNFS